jgi:cobalt-zinc-cadmium efflux system protein
MHHHDHGGADRARSRRALLGALLITIAFAAVEVAGGAFTGSLALMADAGHMVVDAAALGLSLFAAWVATRPTTARKTFGYYRVEILAALVNGAVLAGISGWIAWEALHRFSDTPHVDSGPMALVALAGLLANLAVVGLLLRQAKSSLNVRGAMLDALGDALGSLGAVAAGVVIIATGWQRADPIASLVIAALILYNSWGLLRETVDVLLEGTPSHIDVDQVAGAMRAVPGVTAVHDVHVWTVTSGFVAMSGHAELDGVRDAHVVLDDITRALHDRFDISHVTIQPETNTHAADCCEVICEPAPHRVVSERAG